MNWRWKMSRKHCAGALAFVLLLPAVSLAAEKMQERALDATKACAAVEIGDAPHCLVASATNILATMAAKSVAETGRKIFGNNFRFTHQTSLQPQNIGGLTTDVDMVIPFAAYDPEDPDGTFLQQGVTRWTDNHGFGRTDIRFGLGHRFAISDIAVLGTSIIMQRNAERGHQQLVIGTDYAGQWGLASLQHFIPTTDWRSSRLGFEERPAAGTELDFRLDLTTTISLDTSLGQWERGATGGQALEGRVGLSWQPHSWLGLDAGVGIGSEADSSLMMLLSIPLGRSAERPRWQGTGTFGFSKEKIDAWRPVENVGQIRTIERQVHEANSNPSTSVPEGGNISVRFLQTNVPSGAKISAEVLLPGPAAQDTRLVVSLVPGFGGDPAVAGVDFVNIPMTITIRKGETSAVVSFQLLNNPQLNDSRTLSIQVSPREVQVDA